MGDITHVTYNTQSHAHIAKNKKSTCICLELHVFNSFILIHTHIKVHKYNLCLIHVHDVIWSTTVGVCINTWDFFFRPHWVLAPPMWYRTPRPATLPPLVLPIPPLYMGKLSHYKWNLRFFGFAYLYCIFIYKVVLLILLEYSVYFRTPPQNHFPEDHSTPGSQMRRDYSSPHLSGKVNSYTSPHGRGKKLLSERNSSSLVWLLL